MAIWFVPLLAGNTYVPRQTRVSRNLDLGVSVSRDSRGELAHQVALQSDAVVTVIGYVGSVVLTVAGAMGRAGWGEGKASVVVLCSALQPVPPVMQARQ